jgi:hypothetical protein
MVVAVTETKARLPLEVKRHPFIGGSDARIIMVG